jgi:hypothetical protein
MADGTARTQPGIGTSGAERAAVICCLEHDLDGIGERRGIVRRS